MQSYDNYEVLVCDDCSKDNSVQVLKQAKELFEALRKENIFVRYFNKPRLDNRLRITIGTMEEMQKLITFLQGYIRNTGKN